MSAIKKGSTVKKNAKATVKKNPAPKKAKAPAPAITQGFKGFDKDLKCRDMQFEAGKTFAVDCAADFLAEIEDAMERGELTGEEVREFCEVVGLTRTAA